MKKVVRKNGKKAPKTARARTAVAVVRTPVANPKDRMTGWRRDLASDFGKSPAKVEVVKPQGGGEYLRLVVSPDEVEKYLTKKYPGGGQPVRTRTRSRPVSRAPVPVVEEAAPEEEAEVVRPEDEEAESEEVEVEAEAEAEPEVEVEPVEEDSPTGTVTDGPRRGGRKGRGRAA